METTALSGAALRLHLIQLFLPTAATPAAAVQAARAAYDFIEPPEPCVVDLRWTPAFDDIFRHPSPGGMPEIVTVKPEVKPEPEPLPEPVPPPPGTTTARLLELCRQGLELSEINTTMGWKGSTASARITTCKFTGLYQQARAKRRAEIAAAPRSSAEEKAVPPAPPRVEVQPGYHDRLRRMCQQGLTASQIAAQLGCKHHVVAAKIAKAALTDVWRDAQAKAQKPAAAPEPVIAATHGDAAPPPSSARAELAAHGLDRSDLPPDVPVTKAAPKVWEHAGGDVTIDVVIGWLRHSGDTVIATGKNLWMLNGEPKAASELLDRANGQRKRLRDPAKAQFRLVRKA